MGDKYTTKIQILTFESIKNNVIHELIAEYTREYNDQHNGWVYIFKIYERGRENEDYFDFMLREMENGKDLKVISLFPDNKNYYSGKGVSISIILKSNEIFGKRIISSSNLKPVIPGERISTLAVKNVWEKLVSTGKAKYCKEEDYYYLCI